MRSHSRSHSRDESFHGFFEAEAAGLQRFATFMCGDPDLAADLTQEALTRAYKRWPWLRKAEAPAYVRRIIVNLVRDLHRRGRARAVGRVVVTTPTIQPSSTERVEDWVLVTQALRTLSPVRRATIVLRFYEDMTEHEIAAALGRPLGTVKSDLHRAVRDLRAVIGPRDVALEESG